MSERERVVAPYISFRCPVTKRLVVDQVGFFKKEFPPFYVLKCDRVFNGCRAEHVNTDVEVVAIGHYLGIVKGSEYYSEKLVREFKEFLEFYGYQDLPERPSNERG